MNNGSEKDAILSKNLQTSSKEAKWSYLRQIWFSIIISSGMLVAGYVGASTTMLPKILNESQNQNYTAEDLKFLASVPILFQTPFSLFSFCATERFGPTTTLRWGLLCCLFCYGLEAVSQTLAVLWVSRMCMAAVSYGILGNVIVGLTAEISEPEIRGFCGAIPVLTLSFAILFDYITYAFLNNTPSALSNAALVLLGLIGSICLPESPYWLLKNERKEEAARAVARIIGPVRLEKQTALYQETLLLYENNSSADQAKMSMTYQVKYNMECGAMCFSLDNCFVFNVKKENGVKLCVLIEEIYSILPNEGCDAYFDYEGYHAYHNFTYYRGSWIKVALIQMTYANAIKYCTDRKAVPYHPLDQDDNAFIVEKMKEKNLDFMWYPVNDIAQEGTFKWVNGSVVGTNDPFPWTNGQYGYSFSGDSNPDCAQMKSSGTVTIYSCSWDDAGIVCKSELSPDL